MIPVRPLIPAHKLICHWFIHIKKNIYCSSLHVSIEEVLVEITNPQCILKSHYLSWVVMSCFATFPVKKKKKIILIFFKSRPYAFSKPFKYIEFKFQLNFL